MVKHRSVDDIVAFISSFPGPREVLAFKPSPESQQRLTYLLDQQNGRDLTQEEHRELDCYMLVEHIMRMARYSAKKRLAS